MNLKQFQSLTILIFTFLNLTNAFALPKGNSAWLYGKKEIWITQIKNYNNHAEFLKRLNYLFPETGIIHIDSTHDSLLMTYDPSVTKFYKQQLKNVKILPDLSFWVAHTTFKNWPAKKYQEAADKIAEKINNDSNADGVFLDLESYQPILLPFYQTLVKDLKIHHKILSVIVRPGQENKEWFQTLGNNAFVVLYGYDLHHPEDKSLPVSPEIYQQRLTVAVDHFMQVAKSAHLPVMCGIPLIATTYEWEQKISGVEKLESNYRQIDYFKAALKVYDQISSPLYLGFSIWAFVSIEKFKTFFPVRISQNMWQILNLNMQNRERAFYDKRKNWCGFVSSGKCSEK